MKVKKDDKVLIISGKDKGKQGKVLHVFPKDKKVLIENVNIVKKHQKPKKQGEKGQIIKRSAPIDVSNVKVICPKCEKPTRIGYIKDKEKGKIRVCKKCNKKII